MDNLNFEWDSEKARLIAEKHGLDMERVMRMFDDPFRLERFDYGHSGIEDRVQTLAVSDGVLFAVYTKRNEKNRVITARKATAAERRIYYGMDGEGNWFVP